MQEEVTDIETIEYWRIDLIIKNKLMIAIHFIYTSLQKNLKWKYKIKENFTELHRSVKIEFTMTSIKLPKS